jgi:8-oxo-dGTP pyrophosphatase MutT (NUDIX family)
VYRRDDGELYLVLIRRSEKGIHGGHLAFPGGKPDPEDRSMVDTALREAREEIGIAPETVEILEQLPVAETTTTGFRIFPFLARIVPPDIWQPQEREIAEVIEVRVRDLTRPEAHGETVEHFPTWPEPRRILFYRIGPYRLWGVTYRILQPLIPRLLAGEWDTGSE